MADDTELSLEQAPNKRRKWILIGVALLVLLAGVAGGIWWWLSGADAASGVAASVPVQTVSGNQETLYVSLPRPFVFNVSGDERDRLVQIKVQLMVRSQANEALAKQHIPLVEGTLLQVFSAATAEQLSSVEGKEGIREHSLMKVQEALKALTGTTIVEKVLFTGFIMQ